MLGMTGKKGMMEQWNDGMVERAKRFFALNQHSSIPEFHYSGRVE
jgi:hypothetical protein